MLYCLDKTAKAQFWAHPELPGVRKHPKPDYRWQKVQALPDDPAWHNSSFSGTHDLELYKGVSKEPREVEVLEERTTPPPGWTPRSKGDWRRVNLWRGNSIWWDQEAVTEVSTNQPSGNRHRVLPTKRDGDLGRGQLATSVPYQPNGKRNARNVQTWPTEGLSAFRIDGKTLSHFAAFPRALPLWCIRASCPAQCCGTCGAGYMRIVEKALSPQTHTLRWSPTCTCPQDLLMIPGLILDPFMGSGTTALAAQELGRRCWGIELSTDYVALAQHRLQSQQPAMPEMR